MSEHLGKAQGITTDNLKDAIRQVLSELPDGTNIATKGELQALREEVQAQLDTERQKYKQQREEDQRLNHELREFVTQHSLRVEKQNKKLEQQNQRSEELINKLSNALEMVRQIEDSRDQTQQQIGQQTNTNTQAVSSVQTLALKNANEIQQVRAELSDIYTRMSPFTSEVLGNPQTGQKSLRKQIIEQGEQWQERHDQIMGHLDSITMSINAIADNQGALQESVQKIERRHNMEDTWIRERPKRVLEALQDLLTIRGVALAGTGLGALITLLIDLLGG